MYAVYTALFFFLQKNKKFFEKKKFQEKKTMKLSTFSKSSGVCPLGGGGGVRLWGIMRYSVISIPIFQFAKPHSVLCRLNVKMTSCQKLLKEDAAIFLFVNQNPKSFKAQRP